MDPSPTRKGIPLQPEPPRDSQTGEVFENPGDTEGRDHKREPEKGMWIHQRMSGVGFKQGDQEDESWPVMSSWWSWGELEWGSHQDYWGAPIRAMHQNVGNVGPKSDHVERSDLAKRFFIAGWERERAKRERERERWVRA
jgi:hypothetical protein